MKKALVTVAAFSTLLLGGCGNKTEATIVIFDDNRKEVERIQVDDVSDYGDGATKYWIKGEKHIIKNVPHDIVTKEVKDDE